MDLFDHSLESRLKAEAPLAARMRPRTLNDILGQDHILGPGKLLRRAIEADRLFSSIILWGPPGSGKTTLASVIAQTTHSHFETISAVLAGVAELRRVIEEATERRKLYNLRTILFVDEVHRWNKAQQDALLPHVENGLLTLIGATTENPYFEVIKALVSRSRVFQLFPLNRDALSSLLDRAIADKEFGFGNLPIKLWEDGKSHLLDNVNGDARNALNALEFAIATTPPDALGNIQLTLDVIQESIQQRSIQYDKNGDAHYDTISAFIKSVRGSNPDAALFWLAKMLEAGEDPKFILRRLMVLAGEDIGLADPQALILATAASTAFERLGMPEGIFPIVEATLYLSTAPKSNSTLAYFKAVEIIKNAGTGTVPQHLMDSNRDAKALGHGKGYQYPHDYPDHFIEQQYLPDEFKHLQFYDPSDQGYELQIRNRLEQIRQTISDSSADK